MNNYIVYVHTFPNNKKYVGITCQSINRRWRNGDGYIGQVVHDAIIKYGWDNIQHEIVKTGLSKEEAEKLEIELIKKYNSLSHDNGYNVEKGGNATKNLDESTKKKLSEAHKGKQKGEKHWHYGQHWSDEVKKKISDARKGKKMSAESSRKKSLKLSGENNPMYGTKMTPEHKAKLQEACVKATSKPVICIETQEIFASCAEAHRKTNICATTICQVVNHKPKYKTAGGYHWEFYEEVKA